MLRRIPRILRFIPGAAQDVRAYFLTLQYFLAGSDDNVCNLVRFLIGRYVDVGRTGAPGPVKALPPIEYPEVGVYHPRMAGRIGGDSGQAAAPVRTGKRSRRRAGDALLPVGRQHCPL